MASMFSKRHFEVIAQALQDAHAYVDALGDNTGKQRIGVEIATRYLEAAFKRDNPAFNARRFELATIPGANVKARG